MTSEIDTSLRIALGIIILMLVSVTIRVELEHRRVDRIERRLSEEGTLPR